MTTNGYATRDAILELNKRRFADVEVRGHKFRIRSLTERERSDFELSILSKKGDPERSKMADAKGRFLALVLVGGDDRPLFTKDDVGSLMQLDSGFTQPLWTAAREHCGMDDADMEELVGNSGSVHDGDSPSS